MPARPLIEQSYSYVPTVVYPVCSTEHSSPCVPSYSVDSFVSILAKPQTVLGSSWTSKLLPTSSHALEKNPWTVSVTRFEPSTIATKNNHHNLLSNFDCALSYTLLCRSRMTRIVPHIEHTSCYSDILSTIIAPPDQPFLPLLSPPITSLSFSVGIYFYFP